METQCRVHVYVKNFLPTDFADPTMRLPPTARITRYIHGYDFSRSTFHLRTNVICCYE
jgi:hypothetical protein